MEAEQHGGCTNYQPLSKCAVENDQNDLVGEVNPYKVGVDSGIGVGVDSGGSVSGSESESPGNFRLRSPGL